MTDKTDCIQKTVFVAIDIAKNKHDVQIRWPDGKTRVFKIDNTLVGYQTILDRVNEKDSYENVIAAFEPTADYHRNIAYWLNHNGVVCHLASSLACARAREMLFTSWDKHDRKDAGVILYLLEQGITKPFYDPLVSKTMDIQEISNTYQQITLARTRCLNSLLNHSITLYFPEMERFFYSTRAEWFCHFLLKFPTPKSITRYRKETFVRRAWEVVGRKVAKQQFLEGLHETASKSIALPVEVNSPAVEMFKLQIIRFLTLTEQRKALEVQADTLLRERTDYQILRTLPGVGPVIAMIIIAESGDLKRFSHHRKYLKFCGFNLSASQSGTHQGNYRLSKRGNARLRYAFWLAATVAIRQRENGFCRKYQQCIKKDPGNADVKRKARTAAAVKMARVAHALIKNNTDYRGYYEFGCGTQ